MYNKCNNKNAISICLFCQDQLNRNPNKLIYDFRDKNSYWYKIYYTSLIQFIKDYNNSQYYKDFKLILYLENRLLCFLPELLTLSEQIEICHMKLNSIGASPGALWRLLAFDNKDLDVVFSSDIDVPFTIISIGYWTNL